MTDKELFGNSDQLNCSDCVNHGGDWDCDHVHCRKGTDTISRRAALKGLEDLNIASFYEDNEHSKEAYMEVKAMLKALPSAQSEQLSKINDLVEGTIDHFDKDDAMDLLYAIKGVLKNG